MPVEGRHFATVLFLDIVGSTQIADELGDADWHRLLARFRSAVRTELKHHGGHEVDTAGDGFFATFTDPLGAIRAADAIARSVQGLGLDVRIGIHAGEVETSDKHVTGMTVHVGARTMALAGSAQVLVTSTVRDMEVGGPVGFEDAGEHELKGVPGTWRLSFVRRVDETETAQALDPSAGSARRTEALTRHPRRRTAVVASAVLLPLLAIGALLLARSHGGSRDAPAGPASPMRPVMLQLDVASRSIVREIDEPMSDPGWYAAPGNLGGEIVRVLNAEVEFRDMATGGLVDRRRVGAWAVDVSIGDGAIWLAKKGSKASALGLAEQWVRLDPRTGQAIGSAAIDRGIGSAIWFGPGGGWLENGLYEPVQLDTVSLDARRWSTPFNPWMPVPYPRGAWWPDPLAERLGWLDWHTGRFVEVPIPPGQVFVIEGSTFYEPTRLLLFDPESGTFTPLGNGRLDDAHSFAIAGDIPVELAEPQFRIVFATSMNHELWIATYGEPSSGRRSDSALIGISEKGGPALPTVIPLPDGFEAKWTPLADPSTRRIWVSDCYCSLSY